MWKSGRKPTTGQDFNGIKSKVEQTGYVPVNKTVKSFIRAGKSLQVRRQQNYDFNDIDGIPEGYTDLTRETNDIFEIMQKSVKATEALKKYQDNKNRAKAIKEKNEADEKLYQAFKKRLESENNTSSVEEG